MLERFDAKEACDLPPAEQTIEAWGGAECTVNRVGDIYRDQIIETGHVARPGDVGLIASLELDALRVPVLWERVTPSLRSEPQWDWSDRTLNELQAHGIKPIVGLIHHGSGPMHTSLVEDSFAPGLAAHAARVAERYPHVADWTPVNEPLTTARFSALYGIWYPHARCERLFWLALLNQIDATRLAMRAIRAVRPDARLVQTDDLGRTYATASLRPQAAFDNERRWMSWDLLCGRVDRSHPLWSRLCDFGFERRLSVIFDDPCPPDILGINHYLTSDRLLDERVVRYPPMTRGGNADSLFCDIEAIRVLDPAPPGLAGAVEEAWSRYALPIALTEIHNGCTREEQVRWLREGWETAHRARAQGVDIRAVTAWALFGSQGWNTLLTREGVYEAGAFDTSSGKVRETALAHAIRQRGGSGTGSGRPWWRREMRLVYPVARRPAPIADQASREGRIAQPPLLILGASGTLGREMAAECDRRDIAHVLAGRAEADLHKPGTIERAIDLYEPWAVVNAAGWVRVDDAEEDPDACRATNSAGAISLTQACGRAGLPTLNFSSDLVFDGATDAPYAEGDEPNPLNVYGRSKLEMEEKVAGLPGQNLVVRTAAFFSPNDLHNFASHCLDTLGRRDQFAAAVDCAVSPTYVPDLCRAALDLLIDKECGIWHLTNGEAVTWHAFARRLVDAAGASDATLAPRPASEMLWRAARPGFSALSSERGNLMPGLDSAISRFTEARRARQAELQPA